MSAQRRYHACSRPSPATGLQECHLLPSWYPFDCSFGEAEFVDAARRSNAVPIPHPLALEVCAPRGLRLIHGVPVAYSRAAGELYVERLLRQIERVAPLFDRDRDVVELVLEHFSALLDARQVLRIVDSLGRHFHFSRDPAREFRVVFGGAQPSAAEVASFRDAGLNRATLAVTVPGRRSAALRSRSIEPLVAAIAACREARYRSVGVTLRFDYAAYETPIALDAMGALLADTPERVSLTGRSLSQVAESCRAELAARGYRLIGPDEYALSDDDLAVAAAAGRLGFGPAGYCAAGDCDVLGLGAGALSRIGDAWCRNLSVVRDWEAAIDAERLPLCCGHALDREEQLRADVIRDILCRRRIDIPAIERRWEVDFAWHFSDALARLRRHEELGSLVVGRDEVRITSQDGDVVRIIALCFAPAHHDPTPATGGETPQHRH
jgi:oxygen-independent coproporphyrinogen-3 oxidase